MHVSFRGFLMLRWDARIRELRRMQIKSFRHDRPMERVAATLMLGAIFLGGCKKEAEKPAAAAGMALPVSTIKTENANVPLTGEWVGTMDGYINAQIQPQVSGYLIRQNYREGSPVQKGQILFQIDPRTFQAALDQAQGQLGQAKAQLQLAQINVKRDTPLAQERAIAQSQLDNELQQQAQAEAAVKTAEATVESAQLNLGFTQVRSLIGGVAGQATTQVGNLVSPQSVLTAVSQLNPIKVYFSISDSEYLELEHQSHAGGGDLLRGASKIPLSLKLANGDAFPHKGRIEFVDRQMNAQTGAIRIAATFPNPGNVLRPGQFGRVRAETEVRRNVVLVPQTAVLELQGIQQVYTVGEGNKVHVLNVKLGPQHGDNWIIEEGLSPGTQVITDNLQKLREGAPIAPHQIPFTAEVTTQNKAAGR
jgi:membrane fusion protein (multidrug efflux system)